MTEYVDIDSEVVATTDNAIGVGYPGDLTLIWIPRSFIEDGQWSDVGEEVRVAEWFALQEGLI